MQRKKRPVGRNYGSDHRGAANIMERDEIIQTLRGFVEINRDKYEIIRIGVFGSAARDNMNEQSDIDVVVELGKPDLFYLVGIKQDLEEKFQRPVDIVRYRDRMNAFLKKRIDKEAVYV
jgi:predicted nucleotidyltransferase